MSFSSDLTGVLKAEIGPSATLFYKKCMLHLRKDALSITSSDIEEIADFAYEEIRSMIDEKTAFRVRHRIIQIQPNAKELKRPFSSPPSTKQPGGPSAAGTVKDPGPPEAPAPGTVPAQEEDPLPEPDITSIFSKISPPVQEKNPMAPLPAPPAPAAAPVHVYPVKAAPSTIPPRYMGGTPPAGKPPLQEEREFSVEDRRLAPETPAEIINDSPEDTGPSPEETGPADHPGPKPATLTERIDELQSRLRTEGEAPDLWTELADIYTRTGKFRDATGAYEKVVGLGVETPVIWNCLGDSYKKTGQYEDSDLAYARSLELDPNDPVVWLKRARVLASRNRYDDALACCDHSLTIDESSGVAWHYKAFVLKKVDRNEDALEIYTYLRHLDPKDENAARQETTIRKLLKK
jgi:hypothetical protein